MKLWQRASGALKDKNSIVIANVLTKKSSLRNPDIEAAVIKATSHDASTVDYKDAQTVFDWVSLSPAFVKPIVWAISVRMEKTSSWVVALKGLMLMHGVFCCKVPFVFNIGRLHFDFSNFMDGHSSPSKTWAHNAFIRSYYAFLDQKATFLFLDSHNHRVQNNKRKQHRNGEEQHHQFPMMLELVRLQKFQSLLHMLIQIKPHNDDNIGILILEAMDCILIEILDIYGAICGGIAKVLVRIHSAGKVAAAVALKILQKANVQADELTLYFEYCRCIGALNAFECPDIERIPEDDLRELERIINGISKKTEIPEEKSIVLCETQKLDKINPNDSKKAMAVKETQKLKNPNALKTIITDNWELFDDSNSKNVNGQATGTVIGLEMTNPFLDYYSSSPTPHACSGKDFPDLITF